MRAEWLYLFPLFLLVSIPLSFATGPHFEWKGQQGPCVDCNDQGGLCCSLTKSDGICHDHPCPCHDHNCPPPPGPTPPSPGGCPDRTGEFCTGGLGECQTIWPSTCGALGVGDPCTVFGGPGKYVANQCDGGTETRCCVPDCSGLEGACSSNANCCAPRTCHWCVWLQAGCCRDTCDPFKQYDCIPQVNVNGWEENAVCDGGTCVQFAPGTCPAGQTKCERCSTVAGQEHTFVKWCDPDGGCDNAFRNGREESPCDSRCPAPPCGGFTDACDTTGTNVCGACTRPLPPKDCTQAYTNICDNAGLDPCGQACSRSTTGLSCTSMQVDHCVGLERRYTYTCGSGACSTYQSETCEFACSPAACLDPDNSQTLCESSGFIWMAGTTTECCGDDLGDSGRIVQSTDLINIGQLLCHKPGGTWTVTQSQGIKQEITLVPEISSGSDVLSVGALWFVCDANKDSDGDRDFDRNYDFPSGHRVDDTCRYPGGTFTCGAIVNTEYIEVFPSTGTPAGQINRAENIADDKWYVSDGNLVALGSETIGSSSNPFTVTLTGLDPDPAVSYNIEVKVMSDLPGNEFFIQVGSSGFKQYGEKYQQWTPLPPWLHTGSASVDVQFYWAGGLANVFAVGQIRAIKQGVAYAPPRPIVELTHEYLCGNNPSNPAGLTGERYVECCGDEPCWATQGIAAGEEVTADGIAWTCGTDEVFYKTSDVGGSETLCEALGRIWSGGQCCDPAEAFRWNWRGEEQGCCSGPSSPQCLVSNDGSKILNDLPATFYTSQEGPQCIGDGQYVIGHLCDGGEWRSRNKPLADKLLQIVKDADASNYVIFCDNYTSVLAYYNYLTEGGNPLDASFLREGSCAAGSRAFPCFNNFCVAAAPDQRLVVVSGSYNPPVGSSEVGEIFGMSTACTNRNNSQVFKKCGSNKLWLNAQDGLFIYSEGGVSIPGSGLFSWMRGLFDGFMSWISGKGGQYTLAQDVVDRADTYERFYVLQDGSKEIFAREEGVFKTGGNDSLILVNFIGFSSDLCGTITSKYPGSCEQAGGNGQYIAGVASDPNQIELFDLWQDLTGAVRVN